MKTASPLLGRGGSGPFVAFLAPVLAQNAIPWLSHPFMGRCFFISTLQEAARLEGALFSVGSFLNGYLYLSKEGRILHIQTAGPISSLFGRNVAKYKKFIALKGDAAPSPPLLVPV